MKHTSQSGFSVVELVIAITISAVLSGAILAFMTNALEQNTVAVTKASLLSQAKIGLDKVGLDIRLASNADDQNRWADNYAPTSGNPYSWQSNSTTLILAVAAQDANRNILWQDPSYYIPYENNDIYFAQNGILYKRILAAPETGNAAVTTCPQQYASGSCPADGIVLSNVSAFTVSFRDGYDNDVTASPSNARSVILSITLNAKTYGQTIMVSYTERMVFRND